MGQLQKAHIPVNSDHYHRSIYALFGLGFDQKYSIRWPLETLAAGEPTSSHAPAAFISPIHGDLCGDLLLTSS